MPKPEKCPSGKSIGGSLQDSKQPSPAEAGGHGSPDEDGWLLLWPGSSSSFKIEVRIGEAGGLTIGIPLPFCLVHRSTSL